MSFNELLTEAGDFGLYQKIFCISFLWSSTTTSVFTYWTNVFVLLVAPHRCRLSSNDTWENDINQYRGIAVGECDISFNTTWREKFFDTEENSHENQSENSDWTTIPCPHGWVYDFSTFYPTISTEKDWVCDNAWKMYVLHSCYWAGTVCGFAFFGSFSDRYGRKRSYQACLLLTVISDLSAVFVNSRTEFMIARFFSAMGQANTTVLAFMLGIEYTGPRKRLFVLAGFCVTWTTTSALVPVVPYLLRHWRWVLAASTVPCIIVLLFSNFVPESASWLITRGRIDDAARLIQRLSKVNGRKMDLQYIKQKLEAQSKQVTQLTKLTECKDAFSKRPHDKKAPKEQQQQQLNYVQAILGLFKTPNLRKKTILLVVIWTIACMCYNGNSIEVSNLPFNLYLSYSIGALLELPANMCCLLTLDKIGRRWANFGFLLTAGILGITSGLLRTDSSVVLALALLMRTGLAGGYDTTFTFSSESFPTVVRGRGIAIIRLFGSLASCVAPFIVSLSAYDPLLPLVIFGILSAFAGCATLFVPETAGQHLPHTLEEGEEHGKDQIFFYCPFAQEIFLKAATNAPKIVRGENIQKEQEIASLQEKILDLCIKHYKNLEQYMDNMATNSIKYPLNKIRRGATLSITEDVQQRGEESEVTPGRENPALEINE